MLDRALEILLVNAASATVLAALAVAVRGRLRGPAAVHLLWLVVLAKLLTPPVVEVALIPARFDPSTVAPAAAAADPGLAEASVPVRAAGSPGIPVAARVSPRAVAGGVWLAGSLGLLALFSARAVRFRRLLAATRPVPARLEREVEAVARRLGLAARPRLRVVGARVPPMLRTGCARTELLLPSGLLRRTSPRERHALIAHELAHFRRRDHWVRYPELAALVLFWWHPVAWWARRNLRIAEEASCDALVLEALPGSARDYAEGLLKTLDFLSPPPAAAPATVTGAGDARHLEERLTMIMRRQSPRKAGGVQRWTLLLAAGIALVVFPTWNEPPSAGAPAQAAEPADPAPPESDPAAEQIESELRRAEFLRALERERALAEREADERAAARIEGFEEARRAYEEAAELERHRRDEARHMAEEALRLGLEAELLAGARRDERELAELRRELRALARRRAMLRSEGRAGEAEELERHARELRRAVEERRRQALEEFEVQQLSALVAALDARIAALERRGVADLGEELERLNEAVERIAERLERLRAL